MPRILIVDDEQDFINIYRELLEEDSFQVETATNGQNGLNLILQGGYDIIMLDIIMPQMDGITVLKRLQTQQPQIPNGPIYMLSVLDQADFVKTALKLGAAGYINKSAGSPGDIVDQIKSLVPKNQTTD